LVFTVMYVLKKMQVGEDTLTSAGLGFLYLKFPPSSSHYSASSPGESCKTGWSQSSKVKQAIPCVRVEASSPPPLIQRDVDKQRQESSKGVLMPGTQHVLSPFSKEPEEGGIVRASCCVQEKPRLREAGKFLWSHSCRNRAGNPGSHISTESWLLQMDPCEPCWRGSQCPQMKGFLQTIHTGRKCRHEKSHPEPTLCVLET
jgi:hypothetical protein